MPSTSSKIFSLYDIKTKKPKLTFVFAAVVVVDQSNPEEAKSSQRVQNHASLCVGSVKPGLAQLGGGGCCRVGSVVGGGVL